MKYVGIDIGDGESAVSVVSRDGALLPTVVPLGNANSIRSIVGRLGEEPVIGDAVVLNHAVTDRSARFKSRFLYDNRARQDLRLFAEGLYAMLSKALHDDELKIALGCPAAWKPEARGRYAAIVASAGFQNLYTVSESRAAFLYGHYCNELNLSQQMLQRPTLVIDIGSSTIDYAYIVDGRERDVGVFGEVLLGGGLLDELILKKAVEESPDREAIEDVFRRFPSWKSYCELIGRKLKEEYFLNEERWANTPCSSIAPIYADAETVLTLPISLCGRDMDQLLDQGIAALEGRSFRQALGDTLTRARDMTSEHPPELLLVTGGASRMKFFQEACRETFPQAALALCGEPELSIARGLGIAARTDDMLGRFRGEVAGYFRSGAIKREIELQVPHLLPDYVPKTAQLLEQQGVLQAVMDFQGRLRDTEQLRQYLLDRIAEVFRDRELTEESDRIIDQWIEKRLISVQNDLNAICDRYMIDRADMSLVKIHAEVPITHLNIPLNLRVLAAISQQPLLRKLLWGARPLMKHLPKADSGMTRQLRRRLTAELSDPSGEFAKALSAQLVQELQQQIDIQTQKVEIQIQ